MKQNVLETIIGFIVLVVAVGFLLYAYQGNNKKDISSGYIIHANFQNAEGIMKGSDVMIAGIMIGKVEDMHLNHDTYFAKLSLRINKETKIPKDSSASIVSNGLLGGKFIALMPGAEDEFLNNNEYINMTQSSFNLESLVGKFMFSNTEKK